MFYKHIFFLFSLDTRAENRSICIQTVHSTERDTGPGAKRMYFEMFSIGIHQVFAYYMKNPDNPRCRDIMITCPCNVIPLHLTFI